MGQIRFANGNLATRVTVSPDAAPAEVLRMLGVAPPKSLLLLIGGADAMEPALLARVQHLFGRGLVPAAAECGARILDTREELRQVLKLAWQRFASYDANASREQSTFRRLQFWILILGVVSTAWVFRCRLSPSLARPEEQSDYRRFDTLVDGTEMILQSEVSGWVQDMKEVIPGWMPGTSTSPVWENANEHTTNGHPHGTFSGASGAGDIRGLVQ
jgi:hypothetical protein